MTITKAPNKPPAGDPFPSVLQSLEGSLTVDLIASKSLITCTPDKSAEDLFQQPEYAPFDQIPVRFEDKIIGVLKRGDVVTHKAHVRECLRPLEERMLVGASTGILTYIHLAAGWPYHLVVNGNSIDGIVTRSDLLKLPVRLVLFAFLTQLEARMADVIRTICPGDSWEQHLGPSRRAKLHEEYEKGKARNVYADLLSFTQWCDKRDVLAKVLPKAIRGTKKEFIMNYKNLEDLRNGVMHANDYLTDAQALSDLVRCAEGWIKQLGNVVARRQ